MRRYLFAERSMVPSHTWTAVVSSVAFLVSFIVTIGWLFSAFSHVSSTQRIIREAQVAREKVLRLQLDEETGLRGYLASGNVVFLAPYRTARGEFPDAVQRLRSMQEQLNLPLRPVEAQALINGQWLKTVAAPTLAGRTDEATQLRGKALIDNFRAQNENVRNGLDNMAASVDATAAANLRRTIVLFSAIAVAVCILLFLYTDSQAKLARELEAQRLAYQNEKRIADNLQRALLQKSLPQSLALGLHATYVPAGRDAQVGGDWYDAFELPDGRILFSIGDVAGHGVSAAVTMGRARQAIISAGVVEDDPATVLAIANRVLMLQDDKIVTAICGYIEPGTFRISYATAGHPPPIFVREGVPAFLDYSGLPLGVFPEAAYRTFSLHAHPDSLLVLYTDGVIEHKRNIADGERRLLDAASGVAATANENPALAIHRRMFGGDSAADDVAILTMSFRRHTTEREVKLKGVQTSGFQKDGDSAIYGT